VAAVDADRAPASPGGLEELMVKLTGLGITGRPRKPTFVKALQGTLAPTRTNLREPRLSPATIPEPPADLSDFERKAWTELAAVINPMQIATASDLYAFRLFVQAAGVLASLRQSLREHAGGMPIHAMPTRSGEQVVARPEVDQIAKFQKLCLLHLVRWGLSPSDRSRVTALSGNDSGGDPLAWWRLGARDGQK
jgi:phage terminase small subunit